eukprot:4139767-Pyramimonas_sp.AAC.1
MAPDFIEIRGREVCLLHPASFQRWSNEVQLRAADLDRASVQARLEQASDVGSRARLRQQLQAIDRRARIWVPFSRRLILRAVVVDGA